MKDLMLDIETLGVRTTSVIIQIGACSFDRKTGTIGDTFVANIDVDNSLQQGLTVDWSIIKWWIEQIRGGNPADWMDDAQPLKSVLESLAATYKKINYVWSHSTFDIPILVNAYNAVGLKLPFHYRFTRDIRTLTHLAKHQKNEKETFGKKKEDDKTHNALDDCLYQIEYCVECFNKLKGK